MADKTELYLRRLLDKTLELCAIYEIAVSAEHSESAQVILCQSAHFLDANVEIDCCLTDGKQIFLAHGHLNGCFLANHFHSYASRLMGTTVPSYNKWISTFDSD